MKYRLLKNREIIQEGDELLLEPEEKWVKANPVYFGKIYFSFWYPVMRRPYTNSIDFIQEE